MKKNLILLALLSILLIVAYVLDQKKVTRLFDSVSRIKYDTFVLIKKEGNWYLKDKKLEPKFLSPMVQSLESLELIKELDQTQSANGPQLNINGISVQLGEKSFGANGAQFKKNDKWYQVKFGYVDGLMYRDEVDLDRRKYQLLQKLFSLAESEVKFESL